MFVENSKMHANGIQNCATKKTNMYLAIIKATKNRDIAQTYILNTNALRKLQHKCSFIYGNKFSKGHCLNNMGTLWCIFWTSSQLHSKDINFDPSTFFRTRVYIQMLSFKIFISMLSGFLSNKLMKIKKNKNKQRFQINQTSSPCTSL